MTPHSRTALLIVRLVGMLLMLWGFIHLANFILEALASFGHLPIVGFFVALLKSCIPLAAGFIVALQSRPIAEWLTRDSEE